ncbi:hypothetical protein DRH14_05095 [Candidatus Shapirobacteria bacterium]|nr:MAG: hypothetical protein DRH14_05095 [Candidatus Shapirobacteria bacterium]RLG68742.1 MAG: hypothetical protein DRO11_08665 [Euryarchaeota archaeon]
MKSEKKSLLDLFKFLYEKLGSFTVEVDMNYMEEGDVMLFVNVGSEQSLELKDLNQISQFCDELTVSTDQDGKMSISLLFLPPNKGEEQK